MGEPARVLYIYVWRVIRLSQRVHYTRRGLHVLICIPLSFYQLTLVVLQMVHPS